ncbi:MAG: hypothetical protein KAU94_12815 [Verrucomicrobia bacterium]|nr:hypothetical protein [Verrucomicrobiota bacterium]
MSIQAQGQLQNTDSSQLPKGTGRQLLEHQKPAIGLNKKAGIRPYNPSIRFNVFCCAF